MFKDYITLRVLYNRLYFFIKKNIKQLVMGILIKKFVQILNGGR